MGKLKDIRWGLVGYSLLILTALVGIVLLMGLVEKKDKDQVCSELRVIIEGKEAFIDQSDISQMVMEMYGEVIGTPIISIPIHEIENSLKKLPYVSDADIYMDMDGLMEVKVKQREAILRVISYNGEEFYVDSDGLKIPVTLKYVPKVMVANGYIREGMGSVLDTITSSVIKDLVRIVRHVDGNELWSNQIVQLYVNKDNDIEIIPRIGEHQLILGNADSLDYKLKRLEVFYSNILPKVGSDAYQTVNVKYGGQIICERKGDWYLDSLQMKVNTLN